MLLSPLLIAILLPISSAAAAAAAAVLPIPPPPPPGQQIPIMSSPAQHSVSLADILGTHRSLTTFFSLARQSPPLEALLTGTRLPEAQYPQMQTNAHIVVLAPPNAAVENMPYKPWENAAQYAAYGASAYEGSDGRARAQHNVAHFVEAHIVPMPTGGWEEGVKVETLSGREVWWEGREGVRVIMPDGVEVERVASRDANGELWILKGVLGDA